MNPLINELQSYIEIPVFWVGVIVLILGIQAIRGGMYLKKRKIYFQYMKENMRDTRLGWIEKRKGEKIKGTGKSFITIGILCILMGLFLIFFATPELI